ncbi:MAG: NAD(P)/FAD-dependent oxidoreductase [Terrimesophilobacter sp.]
MIPEQMLIIGAGQAGLATAYHAKRAGIEPVILEAGSSAAGSWPDYYESLRLFSPARYSALPGMPFTGDPDRYPARDEVAEYLTDYAEWVSADIRYDTRVHTVSHESGHFTVEASATTAAGTTFTAPAVVAATGSFGNPYQPQLPGLSTFVGTVVHSSEYNSPLQFAGARVVVVGAGNSAVQIAVELADVAEVTLATRAPIRWLPQRPLGRDVHWWYDRAGFDRAPLGRRLEKIGVTVLDLSAYRAAVQRGAPDRRPMFNRLDGDQVEWADGSREHVDAIILATGFRPNLAYLSGTGALDPTGRPLQRQGISTTVQGLGFVGLEFQRTFSSATVRGVGSDARRVVKRLMRARMKNS